MKKAVWPRKIKVLLTLRATAWIALKSVDNPARAGGISLGATAWTTALWVTRRSVPSFSSGPTQPQHRFSTDLPCGKRRVTTGIQ